MMIDDEEEEEEEEEAWRTEETKKTVAPVRDASSTRNRKAVKSSQTGQRQRFHHRKLPFSGKVRKREREK